MSKNTKVKVLQTKLTREDCLELENLELKMQQMRESMQRLNVAKMAWRDRVEKRYKIDLNSFEINLATGEARRRRVEEAKP